MNRKHSAASADYSKRPKEYGVWKTMKSRCLNPNSVGFPQYGGRGITICERWADSYANFIADMGARPSPHHSIDRIDNSGPYSPDNCRWATRSQQVKNRDCVIRYPHNGEMFTAKELAEEMGIPYQLLYQRIRSNWPAHKWADPPREWSNVKKKDIFCQKYPLGDKLLTPVEASGQTGLSLQLIHWRIKQGWSAEKIFQPKCR